MPSNLALVLLFAVILVAGIVSSLLISPFVGWTLITGGVFGAMILGSPHRLIMLLWLWVAVVSLVEVLALNILVKWA